MWVVWWRGLGWELDLPLLFVVLLAARIATGRDPAPTVESADGKSATGESAESSGIAGCWTIRRINLDNDDRLRAGP